MGRYWKSPVRLGARTGVQVQYTGAARGTGARIPDAFSADWQAFADTSGQGAARTGGTGSAVRGGAEAAGDPGEKAVRNAFAGLADRLGNAPFR